MRLSKLQERCRKYPHRIRRVQGDELAGSYFITVVFKDGRQEQAALGTDKNAAREVFREPVQLKEKFLREQKRRQTA